MAAQLCFRRFRSLQNLCLDNAFVRLKGIFPNTRETLPAIRALSLRSWGKTRTFCSDGRQNDDPDRVKAKYTTNFIVTQGPFGWLSKTVNLWLLKTFIDREFEEPEFLRGAKQALCVVSEQLAKGNWEEIEGALSEKLTSSIKNNMDIQTLGPAVRMEHIISAHIQKVQLGFVENGRGKVVNIQVAFACKSPDRNQLFERQLGNVKIVGIPVPKLTYYTFGKIIFPDSVSDWQVEAITLGMWAFRIHQSLVKESLQLIFEKR